MSDLTPFEPQGALVNLKILRGISWISFRKLLKLDLFFNAVADVVSDPEKMEGLERSPEYFQEVWPLILEDVHARFAVLNANQLESTKADRRLKENDAAYGLLTELLGDALGLTTDEQFDRIEAWIRAHPLPQEIQEDEYHDLCACEHVEHYTYGESFQRVLLARLPWLPRGFNIIRFFEEARVGRFKPVFLYLWMVLGKEITNNHERLLTARKRKRQPFEYVETDSNAVLEIYKGEEQRGKGSTTRISIDPEYGLLLAAVRAEIAGRVNQDDLGLQNFVADLHVPEIVRNLLVQEAHSKGLSAREESRFFSSRAEWLINSCNQFLKGELAWQASVSGRIQRQMEDGGLENWEILLEFEKHAERWQKAHQARQGQ